MTQTTQTPTMFDLKKMVDEFVAFVTDNAVQNLCEADVKVHCNSVEERYLAIVNFVAENEPAVSARYRFHQPYRAMLDQVYTYYINYFGRIALDPQPKQDTAAPVANENKEDKASSPASADTGNAANAAKSTGTDSTAETAPNPADSALSNTPDANKDRTASPEVQTDRSGQNSAQSSGGTA